MSNYPNIRDVIATARGEVERLKNLERAGQGYLAAIQKGLDEFEKGDMHVSSHPSLCYVVATDESTGVLPRDEWYIHIHDGDPSGDSNRCRQCMASKDLVEEYFGDFDEFLKLRFSDRRGSFYFGELRKFFEV
jgi:hypothetical protein